MLPQYFFFIKLNIIVKIGGFIIFQPEFRSLSTDHWLSDLRFFTHKMGDTIVILMLSSYYEKQIK